MRITSSLVRAIPVESNASSSSSALISPEPSKSSSSNHRRNSRFCAGVNEAPHDARLRRPALSAWALMRSARKAFILAGDFLMAPRISSSTLPIALRERPAQPMDDRVFCRGRKLGIPSAIEKNQNKKEGESRENAIWKKKNNTTQQQQKRVRRGDFLVVSETSQEPRKTYLSSLKLSRLSDKADHKLHQCESFPKPF